MKCYKSFFYKFKKSKFIKKLSKSIDADKTYLQIYEDFLSIFKDYKQDRYDQQELNNLFDNYITSKGLKSISEVMSEILQQDQINIDNYVLKELKDKYDDLNDRLEEVQELIVKNTENLNKVMSKERPIRKNKQPLLRSKIEVN